MLFRLWVERPDYIVPLVYRRSRYSWRADGAYVIPGHGPTTLGKKTLLTSVDLKKHEPPTDNLGWWHFWEGYMLLQLVTALPEEVRGLADLNPQLVSYSGHPR